MTNIPLSVAKSKLEDQIVFIHEVNEDYIRVVINGEFFDIEVKWSNETDLL